MCRSLINIAAMPDAMDRDGFDGLVEQDAVVTHSEPEQALVFSG